MPILGQLPVYLALYMNNFVYLSTDKQVEKQFELDLQSKLVVYFMGKTEWFLTYKFDWKCLKDGHTECFLSQSAYTEAITETMGLSDELISPMMTPYR